MQLSSTLEYKAGCEKKKMKKKFLQVNVDKCIQSFPWVTGIKRLKIETPKER